MIRIICFLLLLISLKATGQAVFIQSGSIEYERSINILKQVEGTDYEKYVKEALSNMDRFNTQTFILYFDSTRSLYKPLTVASAFEMSWILGPAKENQVYKNYLLKSMQSQKTVFEEKYLIKDSLSIIKWRITDEKRMISGFDCRKAVGRICDSVYITAFYTDEILVSGGPESFDGLPGMILGIAIPRLHTTWFAKKITKKIPTDGVFVFPSKGKKIDNSELQLLLQQSLKNWGKEAQKNIWWTLL